MREGGSADSTPDKEDEAQAGGASGGKKTRGAKMQMLRKQLDDARLVVLVYCKCIDRYIFLYRSRQAAENETRRDLENIVANLQRDLMERDGK